MRITAIVLAAGGSTRFGKPKQLHLHDGESLVRHAVNAALGAGVSEAIVVLGSNARDIAAALDGIAQARTIINEDWHTGLASSIRAGLDAIDQTDGALITLADQPLIDSTALTRLIGRFDHTHRIVASSYADTIGVPAVFGIEYADDLRALSGDHGAGRWLRGRMPDVTVVPLDAAAIDIDTPADAAKLEER